VSVRKRIICCQRVTGEAALEPGPERFDRTSASACICVHPRLHFFLNGIDYKGRISTADERRSGWRQVEAVRLKASFA
jgi:hypothetical protein